MTEHLLFSKHLTANQMHEAVSVTYLGQAHFAGTGPEGKTCRECVFWCLKKTKKVDGVYVTRSVPPGYFSAEHDKTPLQIKKAKCTRPILNKANRQIPHSALACRLFEPNDNPPLAVKPDATKR